MLPKIKDIKNFLENDFADLRRQSQWDFSGVQVYTSDKPVSKIALSLDPAEDIIEKAIKEGCELLITHHPLFFRPTQGIDVSKSVDRRAVKAIRGGLDILSYHTNLDIAENGTSDYLCDLLGFDAEKGFLSKEGSLGLFFIQVYVPPDYRDRVFEALTKTGAGSIGNYKDCGYILEGKGVFTPNENAMPFIGKIGGQEIVNEAKIEMVVDERYIDKAVKAMIDAHPYEVPAYSIIRLENGLDYGFGKVCNLNCEYTLEEFVSHVQNKLPMADIRTNMEDIGSFSNIGVCTGSGASLWKDCLNRGIKVLLTGDMKYHEALDAAESGVCIVDAGHQATEQIYMQKISDILQEQFEVKTIIYNKKMQMISWG